MEKVTTLTRILIEEVGFANSSEDLKKIGLISTLDFNKDMGNAPEERMRNKMRKGRVEVIFKGCKTVKVGDIILYKDGNAQEVNTGKDTKKYLLEEHIEGIYTD